MTDISNQFTVENIEQTLLHFYNDAESQAQANQFLILAQNSKEAWEFAWELLQFSKPPEIQFFGASTLQAKISKNWEELPPELYVPLRDRLMNALFQYAACGPRIVSTRLCIGMSSFIIQTITDFWPTAVADLIKGFQPQNIPNASHQQVGLVLLELLTVLSEEFQTVRLPQGKIGIVRHALESSLGMVLELIQDILSKTTAPALLCEMALKCYSSWSLLGSSVFDHKNLLLLTFDSVYREEISHTAMETLSNIANHPESSKHPTLILEMVENCTKLDTLLEKSSQDHDMEKCMMIYNLIICMAESHCQLLLETILDKPEKKDVILKFISFILKCSATPGQYPVDEICSEICFGFWYALQDGITSASRFESLLLIFYPVFQSLLDTYLVKLRYPSDDVYKQWKTDEKEAFRCYRQDIGDSVMYCYNILRQAALANLMAHLNVATTTAVNNPNQWQYLEACLFGFKEIAESVDVKESAYIPSFMAHLRTVPLQHTRVISSTMESIGAYAEWINCHPDILGCVIPLLLMGLQNSEFAISATFALKDISRNCYTSMHHFSEQILHSSLEAIKGNVLKPREKIRIMCTVGKVLSIMPYSYTLKYFESLLDPIFTELDQNLRDVMMKNRQDVINNILHMLSMLFGNLDTHEEREPDEEAVPEELMKIREENLNLPQPCGHVLEKLLKMLTVHKDTIEVKEEFIEALCDALKRAISTLLLDLKVFLPDILHLMITVYQKLPHPRVLDITKQIITLFSDADDQRQILNNYLSQLSEQTIQLSMKDFRESTTMVESYLNLLDQILKKAIIFIQNETLSPLVIFQFATAALSLPEKPTVKAAAGFLANFISHSREVPNMLNVVNSEGEMLVLQVLKIVGGEAPRCNVEFMADILMSLNKKYFDNLCRWLGHLIQQEVLPSSRLNQSQKEQFVRMVLKERVNKRKLKETVNEFSLLCRGLIGTEYGAQSCLSFS